MICRQFAWTIPAVAMICTLTAVVSAQRVTFDLWGNQFQPESKGAMATTQYVPDGAKVFNFTGEGRVVYAVPAPPAAYARITIRHHNPLRKSIGISLKNHASGTWILLGTITDTGAVWTTAAPVYIALTGPGRDLLGPKRELQVMATLPQRNTGWSVWYIDQVSVTFCESLSPLEQRVAQAKDVWLSGDTLLAMGESPLVTGGRSPAQDRAMSIRAAQVLAYQKIRNCMDQQGAGKKKGSPTVPAGCAVRSIDYTSDGKVRVTVGIPVSRVE